MQVVPNSGDGAKLNVPSRLLKFALQTQRYDVLSRLSVTQSAEEYCKHGSAMVTSTNVPFGQTSETTSLQRLPWTRRYLSRDSRVKQLAQIHVSCALTLQENQRFHLNAKGVSVAGGQGGLHDSRTALVKTAFATYDKMPRRPGLLV